MRTNNEAERIARETLTCMLGRPLPEGFPILIGDDPEFSSMAAQFDENKILTGLYIPTPYATHLSERGLRAGTTHEYANFFFQDSRDFESNLSEELKPTLPLISLKRKMDVDETAINFLKKRELDSGGLIDWLEFMLADKRAHDVSTLSVIAIQVRIQHAQLILSGEIQKAECMRKDLNALSLCTHQKTPSPHIL